MNFNEYQNQASSTDQNPNIKGIDGLTIPLLGLAGESGNLLSEFKKRLRDGDAHKLFIQEFKEELGDILWYLSNIASKLDLSLEEIAKENLIKILERWPTEQTPHKEHIFFDEDFQPEEQLPRELEVYFKEKIETDKICLEVFSDEVKIGDKLTDNSYEDDGYRFHDIFHLSYATFLGWSPVLRSISGRKRKSNPTIDEVEDGARAIILEELISLYIYNHVKNLNYLEGVQELDFNLMKTIKKLVLGVEVQECSIAQWERAILEGYRVFRQLRANGGGLVAVDLIEKKLSYLGLK